MENLKVSSYLISVELEDEKDKYMLVHGYTGAIDIASKKVATFLETHPSFNEVEIPFSEEVLKTLIDRGYITTKTDEEEQEYVKRMADAFHKRSNLNKSFMFLVTYDCNFRCPYCYEKGISKNGRQWSGKVFTKDMVDKAYGAMLEIGPNVDLHSKIITLYGGEPLLTKNKEIVKYIVEEGVKRKYTFKAITNGYDLNEFESLLSPDKINQLQITVDGRKEYHNKRRIHYKDKNTFDKIVDNIRLALDKDMRVAVRVNTDRNNFEELTALKDFFQKLGFYKYKKFSLNSGLLVSYETSSQKDNIKNSHKEKLSGISYLTRKEYNDLHKNLTQVSSQYFDLFVKLYKAIKYNEQLKLQSINCGGQAGAYIFDPYGEIYSCWEMVGIRKHVLGDYGRKDKIIWNEKEVDNWHQRDIGTLKQCQSCKYAFLCRGGCVAKGLRKGGFDVAYCDDFSDSLKIEANKVYRMYKNNMN